PSTPVIAMSGSAEIPEAVKAMHAGARDFLIKPFEVHALEEAVANLLKPPTTLGPQVDPRAWRDRHAPWLLGHDPAMDPVLALIAHVRATRCTIAITGVARTGKEP